jgi:hypothetical protein
MKQIHTIVATLCLFLLTFSADASRIKFIKINSLDQWEKFLVLAEANNLAIMVEVCEPNQPACMEMRDVTFRDRPLARFINENFISLSIDGNSGFGRDFMATFPVTAYPTFFFGSSDEVFFEKIEGVVTPDLFRQIAQESLDQKRDYPDLVERYLEGEITRDEWLKLLGITELNKGVMEAQPIAREFMLTLDDNDLRDTLIWPFIKQFCLGFDNPIFRMILADRSVVSNKMASFNFEEFFMTAFNFNLTAAIIQRDSFLMERVIEAILPEMGIDQNESDDLRLRTRQAFFSETFNWDAYFEVTTEFVNAKESLKAQYFQSFAQELLESYEDMDAIKSADRLIDEALKLDQTFELLMLKAYLLAHQGNIDEAQRRAFEARKKAVNQQQEIEAVRFINMFDNYQR